MLIIWITRFSSKSPHIWVCNLLTHLRQYDFVFKISVARHLPKQYLKAFIRTKSFKSLESELGKVLSREKGHDYPISLPPDVFINDASAEQIEAAVQRAKSLNDIFRGPADHRPLEIFPAKTVQFAIPGIKPWEIAIDHVIPSGQYLFVYVRKSAQTPASECMSLWNLHVNSKVFEVDIRQDIGCYASGIYRELDGSKTLVWAVHLPANELPNIK
jgi:hypothetical protein